MDAEDARLEPEPRAMVNLETWLPTNFQVGDGDISRSKALAVRGRTKEALKTFPIILAWNKAG